MFRKIIQAIVNACRFTCPKCGGHEYLRLVGCTQCWEANIARAKKTSDWIKREARINEMTEAMLRASEILKNREV